MRSVPSRALLLCTLFTISLLIACQQDSAPKKTRREPSDLHVEPYIPVDGAVGFDILPLGNDDEARRWMATYTDGGSSTKFRIELGAGTKSDANGMLFGQGKIIGEPGSDPLPLLDALKSALKAKRIPGSVKKVDELQFTYAILGEEQTRSSAGGFTDKPKGNWTAMKIFLGSKNAEVFLNFDPSDHQAEFSIKDADYGDAVLAELAKVM